MQTSVHVRRLSCVRPIRKTCHYFPMTTSFYLGPRPERFAPTSWSDVEAAAAAGTLDESRWVELKKDVPASSKGSNRELAKDLASLSVDGGTLIVGIEEESAGVAGEVTGADISSLSTRINQVAQSTVQPPLHVSTRQFPHPSDSALGVMVVSVPASASAPHMVDNLYWGRTEHGKQALGDHDVRRLLADREAARVGFDERLDEVGRNLRAPDAASRKTSQLSLRFEPLAPSYVEPPSEQLKGHPYEALKQLVPTPQVHEPRLISADQLMPDHRGWAATSIRKRDPKILEWTRIAVLAEDNGAWNIVSGGAKKPRGGSGEDLCIHTRHVLELTHIVSVAVGLFSTDHAPYNGEWRVGLAIDNLSDDPPAESFSNTIFPHDPVPFPEDMYRQECTTTTLDLLEHPNRVVEQLLRGFLRGMDIADLYLPYENLADKIANWNPR